MGITNFRNGIFAIPNTGGGGIIPGPTGEVLFVDYATGNDGNDGKSWSRALKTLSQAHTNVTTNTNSIIYVNGNSAVVETAMVTISKNRLTIIGVNGMPGYMGQGARISCTLAATATNIATLLNTGVRNTFIGLKIENANTVAEGLYSLVEAGEFSRYYRCSVYKSSDLAETGAAEVAMNGDTPLFEECTFGSTANETGGVRANVLLTGGIVSGKKCRDAHFKNCIFLSKADDTDHVDVYGANATDVERMLLMENCVFMNNILSSGTPAHAVGFGAAQTQGTVLLKDCTAVDHTVMAQIDMGIYVDGGTVSEGSTGIAVAEVT